jgi:two-component system, OmpR family, sensor kinase
MHLDFKSRLSLWHLVCVAIILAVVAFISDWALARLVRQQVDSALFALATREIADIDRAPDEPLRIHEARPGTAPPSFERLDKFVQIVTLDGEAMARSATLGTVRLPLSARAEASIRRGKTIYETVEDFGAEPIRMISMPLRIGSARYAVQVAGSLDDARATMRAARWLFLYVAVAILAAVATTGALLARRALLPIDHIVTQARRIGESSLAERLPHPGMPDEIGRLVDTLNDMLERIQKSFEVQRHFTADASHELMSPLSRLRAELEVTLRRPRSIAEYEESLRSCLEEVERLSWLTEELLSLARLDSGEGREAATEPAPLAPIVEKAMQRLEEEARRSHVTMVLKPTCEVSVRASPTVVGVAVGNVLHNAVKFCGDGGRVSVNVDIDGAEALVEVSDTGPGVDAEEIPLIFERFHRGSGPRAAGAPGVGLGLAICRALIERQGGRISVASTLGRGATFAIRLPIALAPRGPERRGHELAADAG